MKKLFLILFALVSIKAFSQLQVKDGSFKYVPGGVIDDKEEYTDGNDLPMALIKISTVNIPEQERMRLVFVGNRATQIIKKPKTGSMWIYISADVATFIDIRHPDYGTYKYYLPEELCNYCVYEMVLEYEANPISSFLVIECMPQAEIFIDNKHYGTTPKVIKDISEGQYELVLKQDGFSDVKKIIAVKSGEILSLTEKLSKKIELLNIIEDNDISREYLLAEIDDVYDKISSLNGKDKVIDTVLRYKPIMEDIVEYVNYDTIWMSKETRYKYRYIKNKLDLYELELCRIWLRINKLYDILPTNSSDFKCSIDEATIRLKLRCDEIIENNNGDTSVYGGDKYNHILQCVKTWNVSLEESSDDFKREIEVKEQEVIDKIKQENIKQQAPSFGIR